MCTATWLSAKGETINPKGCDIPPRLLRAFRATEYRVADIPVWIGRRCTAMDRLLSSLGAQCGVFLTAWNPGGGAPSSAAEPAQERRLAGTAAAHRRATRHRRWTRLARGALAVGYGPTLCRGAGTAVPPSCGGGGAARPASAALPSRNAIRSSSGLDAAINCRGPFDRPNHGLACLTNRGVSAHREPVRNDQRRGERAAQVMPEARHLGLDRINAGFHGGVAQCGGTRSRHHAIQQQTGAGRYAECRHKEWRADAPSMPAPPPMRQRPIRRRSME